MVAPKERVYLEIGRKRAFAGGIDWPGWCRSGRDEDSALAALIASGPRYRAAMGPGARSFRSPTRASQLEVVERLEGDATTDFGAPSRTPSADDGPLERAEGKQLAGILEACWIAFDRSAAAARGVELAKGPRGGGRELEAIVRHVLEADGAYLGKLGVSWKPGADGPDSQMVELRSQFLDALTAWARGEPPVPSRPRKLWNPRYAVRRSAWHALDHAWEIEDRSQEPARTT